MKLTDAIDRYFKHLRNIKNASPFTLRNYKRSLDLFLKSIGENKSIADIDMNAIDNFRDHIFELRNKKGETLSRRTQNIYIIPVRAFLKFCTIREFEKNTFAPDKIELLKLDPRNVSGLSFDELNRLRDWNENKRWLCRFFERHNLISKRTNN